MAKEKTKEKKNLVATGIKHFDKLVKGGFLPGKVILLSGTPGTGKTIFALEYLHNGASMFGEKGVYVTFEENIDNLKKQAQQFGWDMNALEKKGMIKFISISATDISSNTVKAIIDNVMKLKAKRLVIDSLSTLAFITPTTYINLSDITDITIMRFIYAFIDELRQLRDTTTLLISQTTESKISRDTVSEFICDGIIRLTYEPMGGQFSRSLEIRKMRQVANEEDIHPLEIGKKGIVVHSIK
ncbi:AAA family ATPase [Candidatus Woesearchaeota archaeon]|nr:AAA family ATPase [Candidatus Woesearchaeota archaeon]